jgi:hypothetical protein
MEVNSRMLEIIWQTLLVRMEICLYGFNLIFPISTVEVYAAFLEMFKESQ